jgi:predicted aspartyl protease
MQLTNQQDMGKVFTTLTIINRADQILAEAGVKSEDQCLPPEAIAQLGLKILKEVDVATAMGIGKARIFRDATISIFDREGTFECLELPGGHDPLLGVIPLESLGLEVDLNRQVLKPLPISPTETYLTIL